MLPTRLSERKKFKDALILSSTYSANPSVSGNVELAILWLKSKIQIWSWCDENIEPIFELPIKSTWRDIATLALNSEIISSAVSNLNGIKIYNDIPPLGQFLGLALTEYDRDKIRAKLLLALNNKDLLILSGLESGLYNPDLLILLDKIAEKIEDEMIEIEDIKPPKLSDAFNYCDLHKAFELSINEAVKNIEEMTQAEDNALAPFQNKISEFIQKWAFDKPKRRYPGGGNLPVFGQLQLTRYIKGYIQKNGKFPIGVHSIPKGTDIFDKEVNGFEINFDIY
jgi:hypothetical protein